MNPQQKRTILLLKDNIDKIINNGIKPNLLKLEKSSKIIKSCYNKNNSRDRLSKECMQARLTVQQLKYHLTELEKCYFKLIEFKIEPNYVDMIMSIQKDVLREIDNYMKTNLIFDCSLQQSEQQTSTMENCEKTQINAQLIDDDRKRVSNAQQNLRDVQSINDDLRDLHDLMGKFGTLVHEQQTTVDNIEENVETAAHSIHEGTKSLAKAASTSVIPIACAAAGAAIFGPIGALITFKVSTGIVSAIGGSALSFSLASYIKNKNSQQSEIELDNFSTLSNTANNTDQ